MDASKKRRLRFRLRTLLLLVPACGAGIGAGLYIHNLPPYPVRQVKLGMQRAEVLEALDTPSFTKETPRGEVWHYGYDSLDLNLVFDPAGSDHCVGAEYQLHTDPGEWYALMPDGRFVSEMP